MSKKFNTKASFTMCTDKKTGRVTYVQSNKEFSAKDVQINSVAEDAPEALKSESETTVTRKCTVDADLQEKLAETEAKESPESKPYKTKASAKAAMTRNGQDPSKFEISPSDDKFVILPKSE